MKSTELVLISKMLADAGIMCSTSIDRDLLTLESRYQNEGLSFLTITLPTFAKGFERSLELGRLDPSLFPSFSKVHNGQIPKFLSGIVSRVFDVSDGTILQEPSVEAIDGVRQVCLSLQKLKMECTDARKRKATKAYLSCESDLSKVRVKSWKYNDSFRLLSKLCFGRLFAGVQELLLHQRLVPKHGPGAVVEKLSGNAKYSSFTWTSRLQRAMPSDSYLFSNAEDWILRHESLRHLSSKDEPPVKVIFVPKTLKTPRVIAIEPTHMQYVQQAFMSALVHNIELDPILGRSIRFTDSTLNGSLARQSSIDRSFATLDLSEASDRVHAALVVSF